MNARTITVQITVAIALCSAAHADVARPTEMECRAFLEQGLAQKDPDKARDRFHRARVRCGNAVALVMIARTYQEHGDLPRALAYLEAFLAAVSDHELRPIVEKTAGELRNVVPTEQRVDISAELAAKAAAAAADDTSALRLNRQVEGMDDATYRDHRPAIALRSEQPKFVRKLGFFIGANFAYAPVAKVDISNERMNGRVEFPAVFAGEIQAGYRVLPWLSVALVPQMLFNLQPDGENAASELELFAQATGHYSLTSRWDINVSAAPGYGVLLVPGGDNASGLVVRWGGGPMYHASKHLSLAAEVSSQTGFQRTGHAGMATSFFTVLVGVRLRP